MMHSTHFIYGYMAHSPVENEVNKQKKVKVLTVSWPETRDILEFGVDIF